MQQSFYQNEYTQSLPSRERGLKYLRSLRCPREQSSLPSRERGLKFDEKGKGSVCVESLPSRERGLKFGLKDLLDQMKEVAPFAGAWIEIRAVLLVVYNKHCRSLRRSVD